MAKPVLGDFTLRVRIGEFPGAAQPYSRNPHSMQIRRIKCRFVWDERYFMENKLEIFYLLLR